MRAIFAERRELKYLVAADQVNRIRKFIGPYVRPDAFVACQGSTRYPISSVYFDSDDLQMARSTVQGERNRVKLRLRTYAEPGGANPDLPAFFEIKRKENGVVRKRRVRTTLGAAVQLVSQVEKDGATGALSAYRSTPLLHEFFGLCSAYRARSVINVSYQREAYECRFSDSVRVTLDWRLCSSPAGCESWFQRPQTRCVPLAGVILEVKFTQAYPAWVADLIRSFELQCRAIPKYVLCAQVSGLRVN